MTRVPGIGALLCTGVLLSSGGPARASLASGTDGPAAAEAAAVAGPLAGFTTPEATRALSLTQALAHARQHQPERAVTRARLRAAEEDLRTPRAGWSPSIAAMAQLNAATANNSSAVVQTGGAVALPRVGGTPQPSSPGLAPRPSTVLALGLRQQVYDFGRIAAQTAVADALLELERSRGEDDHLALTLAVEEAFLAVLAARAVRGAATNAWARAQRHVEAARAGVRSGMRAAADLARAEADLAHLEIALVQAHGGLLAAQGLLAAAIGAEEPAIDAAGALLTEPEPAPADPDLARHPQLRAAAAALRVSQARADALGRELRPSLFLAASFSGRAGGVPASNDTVPPGRGWLPAVPNWDVGLVFSAPLHDGVVRARRRAALAEARVRQAELAAARHRQGARVRAVRVQLEAAERALPSLERAIAAATTSARIAEGRFAQGLGSSLEVSDAAALQVDAEIRLVLGQFEVARGRALLRRELTGAT